MLYFAYGSNLLLERMYGRCPGTELLGRAVLKGYRLAFQENNIGRVVGNIIETEGRKVKGVLYHVAHKDIRSLDTAEGSPYVYSQQTVTVEFNGKQIKAQTYIMPQVFKEFAPIKVGKKWVQAYEEVQREFGIPDDEYLNMVVGGYVEQGCGMAEEVFKVLKGKEYAGKTKKELTQDGKQISLKLC